MPIHAALLESIRKGWQSASLSAGNWAGTSENPIVYMGLNPIKNKKYKVLSTMYAEIYPIENLTIRTQFGVDFTHSTAFLQSFPSLSSNHGQGTAARRAAMPST